MFGQWPEEFIAEMNEFEARYGFELWWIGGGYWSENWRDVFNYLDGNLPDILKGVDYSMEGVGISEEGMDLLTGGITLPDEDREPIVGIHAELVKFITDKLDEISNVAFAIASLVKDAPSNLKPYLQKIHDDIATLFNSITTKFSNAFDNAIKNGVPLIIDVYGEDVKAADYASFPAYIVVKASVVTDFANLYKAVISASDDIQRTVTSGLPEGVVAEYVEARRGYFPKKEKTPIAYYLIGGGFILASVGILAYTVTR